MSGIVGRITAAAIAVTLCTSAPVWAETGGERLSFTTLGTNSGPIPNPQRSEPANLVRYGDQVMLVDAGDGAAEQIVRSGLPLGAVQTVLISHLHFDHTGGLFAFLSLRYQAQYLNPLTIYGPPGIKAMVERLQSAMEPGVAAVGTMRPKTYGGISAGVQVIELKDGAHIKVGPVGVSAVENTHYATLPAGADGGRPVSLSYRFDTPGRSILYTGDTGPSENVEKLCHGADLLVSEIMDPVAALAKIKKTRPEAPAFALKIVEAHFRQEHLSPDQVGLLAQRCGAKALVLTHNALQDDEIPSAEREIAARYKGPISFARDLQSF